MLRTKDKEQRAIRRGALPKIDRKPGDGDL